MKRFWLALMAALLLLPVSMLGQTYQSLWKQVENAQSKDLPRSAMSTLEKLSAKADSEHSYGNLLKSVLLYAKLQVEVAPDSLRPAVDRLEQREQAAKELALKAVYDVALWRIYRDNHDLADNWQARSSDYRRQAMAHPEVLAKAKADDYVPFVIKEKDSQLFNHDLLSIVGMELDEWSWMSSYYEQAGNCAAACLTALHTVNTIEGLDSLLTLYGDLPEACEVAIKRYEEMSSDCFTAAERNDWLEQSLKRWGTWKRANILRNRLASLKNSCYHVGIAQPTVATNQPQSVLFTGLRHLQNLTMRVYRTALAGDTKLNPEVKEDYQQLKDGLTELKEHARTLTFSGHADYDVFQDSVQLAGLPAGVYLLEFSTLPQTQVTRMLYFVSDIRVLMLAQPNHKMRYVALHAVTGQPIAGTNIRLTFYQGRNKPETTQVLTCDKQGEAIFDTSGQRPSQLFAYTAKDNASPALNNYGNYTYYEREYNSEHIALYTDRSIYRPGQTVHVSGIVWKEQSAIDNKTVADESLTLELRDANYQTISKQQVVTDRYGKCSATFTLPTGKLNGRYTIRTSLGSIGFRVEEYKRPTFQVEFADYQESYQQGDTVHAQGKALTYAGVPVQGGQVKYTVKRRVAYWWLNYSWYWQRGYTGRGISDTTVSEGQTYTADDGTFTVDMPMTMPDDMGNVSMFYHFVVEADVTDQAGETHRGTLSLPLGNKPTVLTCDLPQQVRNDQLPPVTFSRRNAAGQEIAGTVRYRVDAAKWQECAANTQLSPLTSHHSIGKHRLEAICEKDTVDMTFVVFGVDDKRPAIQTHDWFYVSHDQFPSDGTPVTLQAGSSDPDLYLVYSIFAGHQLIESGAVKKDAALVNRKFTYKEEYGNGLLVCYAWVKNGKCYQHKIFIRRPIPDKKLRMTWETFRDRLTPGQQEEWRLKIVNPDGTPADASLMAVLYDKSLDAIAKHQWTLSPVSYLSQPSTSWLWRTWSKKGLSGAAKYNTLDVPAFSYSSFNQGVFPVYYRPLVVGYGGRSVGRTLDGVAMMESAPLQKNEVSDVKVYDSVGVKVRGSQNVSDSEAVEESSSSEVQLRENLNETAFFYPALTADQDGRVVLKFTLPESLTTWRFMGVSNTPDMLYGSIEGETVAQKDVMVQPHIPRFIRMGDEATISARIFNTCDHAVSGTSKLQLLDAETEQVIYEETQPFATDAAQSTAVTFHFSAASSRLSAQSSHLFICRISASGEGFSDGEQHYLPILPDYEMVTKTVPYTQHEPGVKRIDLTRLFPQNGTLTTDLSPLTTHLSPLTSKLTIEYTNNPAWLMVQSLPTVGQPWEHSAIDQAASYYSNSLASYLLQQNPQAKHIFEQWKREMLEVDSSLFTLHSSLKKNEDLKDLLLAETPWVADADRESEQKQRLADFFNENDISYRLNMATEKLQKLQNGDGSFSWYPGMDGSTYITVTVAEMLVRLQSMVGMNSSLFTLHSSLDDAFGYLGQEMVQLVDRMKKEEKKGHRQSFPSFTALRWLYICAIDGRQLSADVKAANNYLVGLLKKDIKRQSIYEKALTAVVLAQRGEQTKARQYVKSLKEYTVYTEEMGRYYDTRRASYSWYDYKIPTEVAAIEAIQRVTPNDQQTVDEMRRWLLQEKRTQAWDTPINTVNAIYAFLNGNSSQLTTSQPATTLALDGSPVETAGASAGIGYVKTARAYQGEKTFTATKTSEGTSWGAVYAQFMQKTADIEQSNSGITVKREILTSHPSPLTSYKVGDRIRVRITIETTRDLDFVQVVDRRAACMEPMNQLSGYQDGAYASPKDYATCYFFNKLSKGRHMVETEYYLDRAGQYETGTCTVGCAYAPEYRATTPSLKLTIEP